VVRPVVRGSCPATATAPPSVSRAASAATTGISAGTASITSLRYTATPTLPSTAIPSAPTNSALVSEMPEAAPARSGGALPMIRSVPSVKTGASPSDMTIEAVTRMGRPDPASI
jgi:hypothetical protein